MFMFFYSFSKKEPNLIEQQPPGYGVIPTTPEITPPPPFLAPGTYVSSFYLSKNFFFKKKFSFIFSVLVNETTKMK